MMSAQWWMMLAMVATPTIGLLLLMMILHVHVHHYYPTTLSLCFVAAVYVPVLYAAAAVHAPLVYAPLVNALAVLSPAQAWHGIDQFSSN